MSEKGVIELVLEDKGEGSSIGSITPEEFYNFSFETDWLAVAGVAAAGSVFYFFAGPILVPYALWATLTGTTATVAAGSALGVASGYFADVLEDMVPFKPEDFTYFINNYNLFEDDARNVIASTLLIEIQEKLVEKENISEDQKRFYKAFKDLIQFEDKESDFYELAKTMVTIIDWLFVLNGVTDVQTGNTTILNRYNKDEMTAAISVRVDQILKDGFSMDDSSDFRQDMGFERLADRTPYIIQGPSMATPSVDYVQLFRYFSLTGTSKIISDDLEEVADSIASNIESMNNQEPGMRKYANLIGNDFVDNILTQGIGWNYISFPSIGAYQYNGETVEPDWDGWEDEEDYDGKEQDIARAKREVQSRYIKIEDGLSNTSVVSFGEEFDPKLLETDLLSGVDEIPQPGINIGEVVKSLIDAGYAFFVAELGQNAFNNKDINQKTLFDESVIYYSEIIARVIGTALNNVQKFALYLEYSALFVGGITEEESELFDDAKERARSAADAAAKNIGAGGGLDASIKITDEQLKNRQKFVKQCILMYNMDSLRTEYRTYIKDKGPTNHPIHGNNRPFGGRFHAIEDTDSLNTNTINKMIVPKGKEMKPLLEITPDIHAFLVPKIRLFRVVHRVSEPGLIETEFDFRKTENRDRIEGLMSAKYDKGNSYGIKSFDFSFEGTNPATARNDIVANLQLHFQSFQDFIETRTDPSGEEYQFVDLIIFPVNKKNRKGIGTLRAEEYDPSIYRIRAEVGWMVPERHDELDKVLQKRKMSYDQLKKSLILTNKSFYLNMVDHNFSIKDDGTVDINISYRAYIESALKSTKFDALTTPALRRNREKFKETMLVALQKDNCSNEEIKTIKELFKKTEEETIKKVYRSLLSRLNDSNSIFFVDAHVNDIKQFRRDGFFSRGLAPRLLTASGEVLKQVSTIQDMQEKASGDSEFGEATLKLLQDGVKDYPDEDMKEDNRINFFYLGDLIYTILDNMYDEQGNQNIDMNNTKLLLSSFSTFGAFGGDNGTQNKSFNIIDIPVSVEYFYEWFTQNVIKPKRL